MKQPAKFSIAGLILAVLAVFFYPKQDAGAGTETASPAVSSSGVGGGSSTAPAASEAVAAPRAPVGESPAAAPSAGAKVADAAKAPARGSGGARAPPAQAPTKSPAQASTVGFTSRQSWLDHFEKHGAEFGKITVDDYLARAQALRDAPLSPTVLEGVRADGVITRFDAKSGAFIAFHKDKTIRTFFRPNDGRAYFKRQLER